MNNGLVWTHRAPFADFDSLIKSAFGPATARGVEATGFTPATDIHREGDDAVVTLALPGLDVSKDVTAEVKDGRLVVHGERRDERSEKTDGRTLHEIRYGSFERSFTLPKHVGADAISASYDAGLLTITVAGVYADTAAQKIAIASGTPMPAAETIHDESAEA